MEKEVTQEQNTAPSSVSEAKPIIPRRVGILGKLALALGVVALGGGAISEAQKANNNETAQRPAATGTLEPTQQPAATEAPTPVVIPTPTEAATPQPTPAPTETAGTQAEFIPFDWDLEKDQAERLKQPLESVLSQDSIKIREDLIGTADEVTGFLNTGDVKNAVLSYDEYSGYIDGQITSTEGKVVQFPNGKNYYVFDSQIESENWLREKGLSQQDVCNIKLNWGYHPQTLNFENFSIPAGVKFTSAPLSCYLDTTTMNLPKSNP